MSQEIADVMETLGVDRKTAAFVLDAKLNGFNDEEILDAIRKEHKWTVAIYTQAQTLVRSVTTGQLS